MVAFEKWLVKEYPQVMPRGRIGKAIKYTYEIYHRLTRYHPDGRYRIDNNMVGNSIRPPALGQKNYLFCDNHDTAEDAAVIYSLPGCCKAAGVNFCDRLVYTLFIQWDLQSLRFVIHGFQVCNSSRLQL